MDHLFNNGTAYKIQYIYNLKILCKVTIAYFCLLRYIDVAYSLQGHTLISRGDY